MEVEGGGAQSERDRAPFSVGGTDALSGDGRGYGGEAADQNLSPNKIGKLAPKSRSVHLPQLIHAGRHMRLNRLGRIRCHLSRKCADLLGLGRKRAELIAPIAPLQL